MVMLSISPHQTRQIPAFLENFRFTRMNVHRCSGSRGNTFQAWDFQLEDKLVSLDKVHYLI